MQVSSRTPTKSIVDTVLAGGLVVSTDYGPHLMHWTMAIRSALTTAGRIPPTTAATLRDEQRSASCARQHLRRVCVAPSAWIDKYGEDLVRWVNRNMAPPTAAKTLVPFHDARERAFAYPELLAYRASLALHKEGMRPLPHLRPLFPYHQVYCPGTAAAKLYVSLFKWLSTTIRREKCWTALDWQSQSGIISRSLLNHGVRTLVCVDGTARCLKTTKESIVNEVGLTQYTKLEQSNAIQLIQHTAGELSKNSEKNALPPQLAGMKFDIIVQHMPLPLAALTPHTDMAMHAAAVEASTGEAIAAFLDHCESALLRCPGRYVVLITHNYHTLVNGEPPFFPLPEPTNWEIVHRDRCSFQDVPAILGPCGEQFQPEADANAFFLQKHKYGEPSTPLWAETYLANAAAYLWVLRLKGARRATAAVPAAGEGAAEKTVQTVEWKKSADYSYWQPKDGPLLANQLSQIRTFSFLEEVDKAAAAAPKLEDGPAEAQKAVEAPRRRPRGQKGINRRRLTDREVVQLQKERIEEQLRFLNTEP